MSALWLVLVHIVRVLAEAGWNDPDICNGGEGWKKIPDPYKVHHPPKPYDNKWQSDDASLVVLIASLRETRCPDTLISMYTKATNPNRIFFGIVQQNDASDVDCQVGACEKMGTPAVKQDDGSYVAGDCKLFNQVRMYRMKASEARGPVFARGHQQTLVEPEDDFCMQIDAHTDVVQDWDRKILDQWGSVDNEYAILTSYPTNVHDLGHNSNRHWEMPILCKSAIIGPGLIRNHQASACANLRKPVISPLWAAGLSFGNCHHERNVPNDKNLKGVFMGEEFARGARLWTFGYDFYAPSRPVVGTYYGGEKGGSGHYGNDPGDSETSKKRLTTLLNWPNSDQSPKAHADLGKYDLGKRRTLDQYNQFSGMDTQKRGNFIKNWACENLTFVPWNTDDAYSEYPAKEPAEPVARIDFVKASIKGELDYLGLKSGDQENGVSILKLASFSLLLFSCLLAVAWKFNLLRKKQDHSKYSV